MAHEELLRELHTGLALVKQQQTEINRRLGAIESALKSEDEKEDEKRSEWVTWVLQTVGQVILVSALVYVARSFGIEVAG